MYTDTNSIEFTVRAFESKKDFQKDKIVAMETTSDIAELCSILQETNNKYPRCYITVSLEDMTCDGYRFDNITWYYKPKQNGAWYDNMICSDDSLSKEYDY